MCARARVCHFSQFALFFFFFQVYPDEVDQANQAE